MNKHLIWSITLILIFSIICGTLVYLNSNPYSIKIEMDDNTKEAFQSINYTAIGEINKDFDSCKPIPCPCWEYGCLLYCMECENDK